MKTYLDIGSFSTLFSQITTKKLQDPLFELVFTNYFYLYSLLMFFDNTNCQIKILQKL